MRLSEERSLFCAGYLSRRYGISAERVKTENYGAEKNPEFKDASWESYRCVELIIE
jgi:outer membrane protein OmpA-like peptidoglycan-associated protein